MKIVPVVIVDSLTGGTYGMHGSANFDQNVVPALRALQDLASHFDLAVILSHHLKTKGESGFKASYDGFDLKTRSSKLQEKDICGSEVLLVFVHELCCSKKT